MTEDELKQQMRETPGGQLLVRAGFEPYDTESAARRVADHAAEELSEALESLATMTTLCRLKYGNLDPEVYAEIEKSESLLGKLK